MKFLFAILLLLLVGCATEFRSGWFLVSDCKTSCNDRMEHYTMANNGTTDCRCYPNHKVDEKDEDDGTYATK